MKKLALLCLLIALPAFANDFDMRWYTAPGEWVVPGFIDPPLYPDNCGLADRCYGLMFEVKWNEPTCFRYEDVFVTRGGQTVPATVTEIGVRGEPGWVWTFGTEPFAGAFEFHVKTINVCPKVG
jgi:hypothetical protein